MIFPAPTKPPEPAAKATAPLRAGPGMRIGETPFGRALSVLPGTKWHHPWFTRLAWLPGTAQWVATVKPGLVNGYAPTVRVTSTDAADAGQDYGINPLTGKPYFSADIFNREKAAPTVTTADIPLYYYPPIPLQLRKIGWDSSSQSVPSFFQARGVNPPPRDGGLALDGEPVNAADSVQPKGNRLLRAADIILHQPRPALTSSITLEPGIATGLSNVTQTLGLRAPAAGDRIKVFSGSLSAGPATDIDPLAGDYEEPNFDEIRIATVYLLSPPNTPPGSEPDATWQPYVQHNLFWNLCHVTPTFEISTGDLNNAFASLTRIGLVLGGGTGSIAINFAAAGLNDLAAQALNMIRAHSMAGTFYTATGGGHLPRSVEAQATANTANTGGLSKAERLAAQRQAAQRAIITAKLDPAFPYQGLPFPIEFL